MNITNDNKPLGLEKKGADQVAAFFEAAALPLPEEGEYFHTNDHGRVVFLTPFGCTIRVTEKTRRFQSDHPHILKPLFAQSAGHYQIDINPGIETPLPNFESYEVAFLLYQLGLNIKDAHCNNFGIIPGSMPRFPVILDPDSHYVNLKKKDIKNLSEAARQVKLLMKMDLLVVPEDELVTAQNQYDPLRVLASRTWPANSNTTSPLAARKFWLKCAAIKEKGQLASPWENPKNTYRSVVKSSVDTTGASAKYLEKLKKLNWVPG